jgi:hypothetical protein
MFNYALWHNNPAGYHLSSLMIHICVCILIFKLVEILINNKIVAFSSSLLFGVHPIHTESVSFISYGLSNVSIVSFLLALIFFLKFVLSNRKTIFYSISLICFSISIFTMETTITLPLIMLCIDYLFLSRGDLKSFLKSFWRRHVGYFIILGLYLWVRSCVLGWSFLTSTSSLAANFTNGSHAFWRFFTVLKILGYYIRLLFMPYNLMVEHIFPPANSLFEPQVLVGMGLASFLIFISFRNKRKYPILSFSILWCFITMLPVSNIIPQGNIFSERYTYLCSIGFCIGIGFLVNWLFNKDVKTAIFNWKKSIVMLSVLSIIALGRVTYERNKVWDNNFTLWYDSAKKSANSPRAHINLGNAYFRLNLFDKAIEEYGIAMQSQRQPSPSIIYYSLNGIGCAYSNKDLLDESIKYFMLAIEKLPNQGTAFENLADAYYKKRQFDEAVNIGLSALEKNPYLVKVLYTLAVSYKELGMLDKSIKFYEKYLEINRGN